jgi:uncharacterized membrane protein
MSLGRQESGKHPGRLSWLLALLVFGAHAAVPAAEIRDPVVTLPAQLGRVNLTGTASFFHDESGVMQIENVIQPGFAEQFELLAKPSANLGLTTAPLWARITLNNPTAQRRWVIEVENPRMAGTEFYWPDGRGGFRVRAMGTGHDLSQREFLYPSPAFAVSMPTDSTVTFYLRIQHSGSLRFRLLLWTRDAFGKHIQRWAAVVFICEGMLLALAFQGLFIFAGIRERSYLLYSILIFLFFILHLARYGVGHLYVWPNTPWWTDHSVTFFGAITLAAAMIFSDTLLNGPQNAPPLSKAAKVLAVLALLQGVLALVSDSTFKYYLGHVLGAVIPLAIVLLALQAKRRGFRPARIFLVAWGTVASGVLVTMGVGVGLLPMNWFTEHVMDVTLFAGVMLWSFSLTDRMKVREEESRRLLEQTVTERTSELRHALDEVKTLHGLLPICSHCKKIRDDSGYWQNLESYISEHTGADFSHSLCPNCLEVLYPDFYTSGNEPGTEPQMDANTRE